MKITFLGHGFKPGPDNSVGSLLVKYLNQNCFHSFVGISAFTSEGGISILLEHLKKAIRNFDKITLIVGIDQEGTSKEALESISELDVSGYIFYQKEQPIFHPKLYLFEGDDETKLILGSSNLTAKGLFTNVESSLLIEFPKHDQEGDDLINSIKSYYDSLFDLSDPNLFKITPTIINDFILKGIVPKEKVRFRKYIKEQENDVGMGSSGLIIPSRTVARIPGYVKKRRERTVDIVRNEIDDIPAFLDYSQPIWSKLNLVTSDILIPRNTSTNTTGRLKLTKAGYDFDLITHFRFNVFNSYNWSNRINSDKQDLTLKFKIVIDGVDKGDHNLKVTYNPKGDSNQHNYNTSISWKGVGNIIREKNLTGKDLYLYKINKTEADSPDFAIVIE